MAEKRSLAGGGDGWLNIRRKPSGAIIAAPEYLQVELASSHSGRDYFTVAEGSERGKNFSVTSGNLQAGNPGYRTGATLQFNVSKQLLVYPGGVVKAITDPDNPIGSGIHPIQIPDFPHGLGAGYVSHPLCQDLVLPW